MASISVALFTLNLLMAYVSTHVICLRNCSVQ